MRRLAKSASLIAVAVACLMAGPAHAAKIDSKDVRQSTLVVTDFTVPVVTGPTPGNGGGYASCPPGLQTLTGGAFLFPTGQTPKPSDLLFTRVNSSSPTTDNLGWYADASNGTTTPMTLRILLRCVPDALVADQKLVIETRTAGSLEADGAVVECEGSRVAISGGAFVHRTGVGPEPSVAGVSWIGSSGPVQNASGWYGDFRSFEAGLNVTVTAHCLPKDRLKGYKLAETDFKAKVDGFDYVKNAKCPKARPAAIAAGAYIHKPNQPPDPQNAEDSILKASGIFGGVRGFVVGYRSIDDKNFRVSLRAFCVK